MLPLELIKLTPLMDRSSGRAEVKIGLIDGPVAQDHPDLSDATIRAVRGTANSVCTQVGSAACLHGTFVAGILVAKRGSAAPAICPGCTLLVRPIFADDATTNRPTPRATPEELAEAICDCIAAGAGVVNVSAALTQPSINNNPVLGDVLDYALGRGVLVVVAAGNQGTLGSTSITRHPWVIPVVAYDNQGKLLRQSNFGASIGRRGLGASGDRITSLGTNAQTRTFGGTSAAAPFVTGTIALLWSLFPQAPAAHMKLAITQASSRRAAITPPLLDAWAAYQYLLTIDPKGAAVA